MSRLEFGWSRVGPTCGTEAPEPTGSTFDASSTALDAEWSYSPTGKTLSVVNGAAAPVTDAFSYTDPAYPSAVTGVSHTGGLQDVYVYDDAGRMTQRTVDAASPETPEVTGFVWDVSSNLVESTGAGGHRVYLYDASGQRVAQVRVDDAATAEVFEGTATVYFGATEATDPNTSPAVTGDVTGTRFYTFGGVTVAVREAAPGVADELSLVLGDFQGSAQVMMPLHTDVSGALEPASALDASAALLTRNAYTPYGAVRGADNLSIDHGWLNQVSDEATTGLVYLNARYYDPQVARFISPDPLMNPSDPKTLDPYRYAENNPVTYTDASGLLACGALAAYGGQKAYKDCLAADKAAGRWSSETAEMNAAKKRGERAAAARAAKLAAINAEDLAVKKRIAQEGAFFTVSNWGDMANAGGHGLVNFGGGFVNGASGLVNGITGIANWGNNTCASWGVCTDIPDIGAIPAVPIWGDYDTYKYSSWAGSASFQAALTAGTAGASLGGNSTRVLWSGYEGGAMGVADALATATGGVTLRQTAVGKVLEWATKWKSYEAMAPAWDSASRAFALQARGTADLVVSMRAFDVLGSTFSRIEAPALAVHKVATIWHVMP